MHSCESKVLVWFNGGFVKFPVVNVPKKNKAEKREEKKTFISQFAMKYCKKSTGGKFNHFLVITNKLPK